MSNVTYVWRVIEVEADGTRSPVGNALYATRAGALVTAFVEANRILGRDWVMGNDGYDFVINSVKSGVGVVYGYQYHDANVPDDRPVKYLLESLPVIGD